MALFKANVQGLPPVAAETPARPAEEIAGLARQCAELREQLDAISRQLSSVSERESELRAVIARDTLLEPHLDRLTRTLGKSSNAEHIVGAIDRAELRVDPYPFAVIDNLLPPQVYAAVVRGIPPVELFAHKPAGKQQLPVPFELAPVFSRRAWRYLAAELVPDLIAPRLIEKFRPHIDEWIVRNWPAMNPHDVTLHGSGGRVMLHRRGYRIRPHRDPKWSFITCILYLARPGDDEAWGTQLFAVENDREANNAGPYWIEPAQCRLVEDVRFVANRLLVFLNSVGAHGAHIPDDAQPEDLERYIYQFRVGPSIEMIATLKAMLPDDRKAMWTGKALVDY